MRITLVTDSVYCLTKKQGKNWPYCILAPTILWLHHYYKIFLSYYFIITVSSLHSKYLSLNKYFYNLESGFLNYGLQQFVANMVFMKILGILLVNTQGSLGQIWLLVWTFIIIANFDSTAISSEWGGTIQTAQADWPVRQQSYRGIMFPIKPLVFLSSK